MSRLQSTAQAARELGIGALARYARYQLNLRSGWIRRRTPVSSWDEQPVAAWLRPGIPSDSEAYAAYRERLSAPRFFFDPSANLSTPLRRAGGKGLADAVAEADDLRHGLFRVFGLPAVRLGFPPDWSALVTLFDDAPAPSLDLTGHWSRTRLDKVPGDIKLLWELSRFGWVFPMVRAYRSTGRDAYAGACWELILSWSQANQPNAGAHWISAQEVALRLMALAFAFYGLAPWLRREATRISRLASMILVHAARIPPSLDYARAQGNNHLITEAVGLYTAGMLFPEAKAADSWRRLGREVLTDALRVQVFADGGYIQHSANYHRLVLQACTWAASLAACNRDPLPPESMDAIRRLSGALESLVDHAGGDAPNFGPNDGACILPLTSAEFTDYRPALQAAAVLTDGRRLYPPGPWDEAGVWLGLDAESAGTAPAPPAPRDLPDAGLHTLIAGKARAVLRCARFTSRPGHSDQLHLDLRRGRQPVAIDAGTYLYNGVAPWDNALAGAAVHNTVLVDGLEPMQRAGRFLWLNWAQGRVLGRWGTADGRLEAIAAEHDGYRRLGITHRRTVVRIGDSGWLVVDDILGDGDHTAKLGWLLADGVWRLRPGRLSLRYGREQVVMQFGAPQSEVSLCRAGERVAGADSPGERAIKGWVAWTYADRQPALRLEIESSSRLPLRMLTWFTFDGFQTGAVELTWNEPGIGLAAIARAALPDCALDLDRAHPAGPSSLRRAG
jgi:hypothetical protein